MKEHKQNKNFDSVCERLAKLLKEENNTAFLHRDYMEGHLLLEIFIDEKHYPIFNSFLASKYSKMYTKEQINKFFNPYGTHGTAMFSDGIRYNTFIFFNIMLLVSIDNDM